MKSLKLPLLLAAAVALPAAAAFAADVIKANNTNALNLTTSWVGGAAPTSADVVVWDSTVTAANATIYGANASWAGIRIVNPAGLVTIGNTTDTTTLTLGASGIDMSAATQNLLINGNLVAGAAQTWSVASGRTLQIETINTNRTLTGSGDISLVNSTGSGTATFNFNPGASGSTAFTAQAGFSGYTGNWTIGSGVLVKTLRNGINAWGSGTITLAGGTVGQQQNFSGVWTNNIILQASTASVVDDFNTSGTRSLKLNGVISGSGNLTFQETNAGVTMNADISYILGGTNTMSGTVTVASGTFLRVGSIGGNDSTATNSILAAGTTGDLGTAAVVNNGTLSFTRSNAIAVANNISGTGAVNIGSLASQLAATSTQIVTLSGTNSYSGGTTINTGKLILSGSGTLGATTGALAVNGGTLDLGTTSQTVGAVTLGGGTITNGTLSGTSVTTTGGTTTTLTASINAGAGTVSITGGSVLTVQNGGSITTTGALSLAGAIGNVLNVNAGGSVSVGSIANNWQSNYAIDGTLTSAGAWAISTNATGTISGTAGTMSAASFSLGNAATTVNFTNTGSLTVSGAFTTNSDAGTKAFNQSAGTVNLTSSANVLNIANAGTGTYALSGGTLNAVNAVTNLTFGGTATGNLNVSGGTANLRGVNLTASASSTGTLNLTGGRINLGAGGITNTGGSATSSVNLGAGTIGARGADWNSSVAFVLTNAATGTTFNTLDSVDGVTDHTIGLSGALSGAGKLIKEGVGTLNLSGVNTYAGGTSINTGTIATDTSTAALGTGAVTIGGGTLSVGAAGITGIASLTVNTGTLNTSSGAITTTGAFALAGGTWTIGNAADGVTSTAAFTLTGGSIDLLGFTNKSTAGTYSLIAGTGTSSLTNANFTNGDAGFTYSLDTNGDLVVTAVPEPSTYGLIGAGVLAAVAFVRRRRKHTGLAA